MLYALLCYHDEALVNSWTKEEDDTCAWTPAIAAGAYPSPSRPADQRGSAGMNKSRRIVGMPPARSSSR